MPLTLVFLYDFGLEPQVTTQKIAALARQRAMEKDRQTPFSAATQEVRFYYYGGKLDFVTMVVCCYQNLQFQKKTTYINSEPLSYSSSEDGKPINSKDEITEPKDECIGNGNYANENNLAKSDSQGSLIDEPSLIEAVKKVNIVIWDRSQVEVHTADQLPLPRYGLDAPPDLVSLACLPTRVSSLLDVVTVCRRTSSKFGQKKVCVVYTMHVKKDIVLHFLCGLYPDALGIHYVSLRHKLESSGLLEAAPATGLKTKEGVVLAVEKLITSPLLNQELGHAVILSALLLYIQENSGTPD
ncbi:probable protein phosphatase 2C 55 [Tanacetum coccineum]